MSEPTAKQRRGKQAEQGALDFLQGKGLKLLQRNYFCRLGEIDLIMQEQRTLVFVEVRYRKSSLYGTAAETVNQRKQTKLIRAALHYLQHNPRAAKLAARFDVVGVSGEPAHHFQYQWIANAFQAYG